MAGALDNIRVERALGQEVDSTEDARLLGEDADELGANDASFFLGIGHTAQRAEKSVDGVDVHQAHPKMPLEGIDHTLRLTAPQEAVIDEDAGQLIANGAMGKRGHDRRINPTRERADHAPRTHLTTDIADRLIDERRRRPVASAATDIAQKIADELRAETGVDDLRVELQNDQSVAGPHRRGGRVVASRRRAEARA